MNRKKKKKKQKKNIVSTYFQSFILFLIVNDSAKAGQR